MGGSDKSRGPYNDSIYHKKGLPLIQRRPLNMFFQLLLKQGARQMQVGPPRPTSLNSATLPHICFVQRMPKRELRPTSCRHRHHQPLRSRRPLRPHLLILWSLQRREHRFHRRFRPLAVLLQTPGKSPGKRWPMPGSLHQ